MPMVESKMALVAPAFKRYGKALHDLTGIRDRPYAHPVHDRCQGSTTSFIMVRSSRPLRVCFMGRKLVL
jgi:hypothetical protein